MEEKVKLTPSLEDYLETILQLEKKNRVARVKDIAGELKVQMPSVSGALKTLKSRGLIEYEKNSFINLTQDGTLIAKRVYEKHKLLVSFLENTLLLDKDSASEIGCKIEHVIDMETAHKLSRVENYLATVTQDRNSWLKILNKK